MKKIIRDITIILLLYVLYYFLSEPGAIILSVNESVNIFFKNIFPNLFPFFLLSSFLINYDALSWISILFSIFFKKLFNFNERLTSLFLLCLISGLPSNAKYIKDLLDYAYIDVKTANYLLCYTFFPNPMFVIGLIGHSLLGSLKVGYIILFSIYISNFILAFLLRNKISVCNNTDKKNASIHFSSLLSQSIKSAVESLMIILGNICIFIIIRNIIQNTFNLSPILSAVFNSILEMSSGIVKISNLNISLRLKTLLISSALSFSGISVLSQAIGILGKYKLNIKIILFYKIIGALLSLVFTNYLYIIFR